MLLFIGTSEIIFILFVVLLLFGSKKIPEVARTLGRGFREFQKATDEIKREISKADLAGESTSETQKMPPNTSTEESNRTENQQKNSSL